MPESAVPGSTVPGPTVPGSTGPGTAAPDTNTSEKSQDQVQETRAKDQEDTEKTEEKKIGIKDMMLAEEDYYDLDYLYDSCDSLEDSMDEENAPPPSDQNVSAQELVPNNDDPDTEYLDAGEKIYDVIAHHQKPSAGGKSDDCAGSDKEQEDQKTNREKFKKMPMRK